VTWAGRAGIVLVMALAVAGVDAGRVAAQGAPAPKVILLRPPSAPSAVIEALIRLGAELMLEGFDPQVMEFELVGDTRNSLELLAPTLPATAIVAVVAGADPATAELWVVDRMTGKTVVRRIHADPKAAARMAEILSVRAVELLRASFLELAITSRPRPDVVDAPVLPVEPVVKRFATEPLVDAEPDWKWAFEAGAGGIGAASGLGGALAELLPVARIERALGARLCVRVTFAGLGTQSRVDVPGGFADVSQTVVLAEALFRFRRGNRLEPVVSVGAGMLRLAAEGHVSAPYTGIGGWRAAAAADAGVGMRVPLRQRRLELGVEVHALLAEPYPVVRFFETDVARAGRPTLLAAVTLLGGI